MKEVIRERFDAAPYSLHDARMSAITRENDELLLTFDCGYIETTPPYRQVQGNIRISGIDLDFCSVYLMEYPDVLCGNYGEFRGRKLPLDEFVRGFEGMDVLDETYGYNQLKLAGFNSCGEGIQDCIIEVYYEGDMCYLVEE